MIRGRVFAFGLLVGTALAGYSPLYAQGSEMPVVSGSGATSSATAPVTPEEAPAEAAPKAAQAPLPDLLAGDFKLEAQKQMERYHAPMLAMIQQYANAPEPKTAAEALDQLILVPFLARLGVKAADGAEGDYTARAKTVMQTVLSGNIPANSVLERAQLAMGAALAYDWLRANHTLEERKSQRETIMRLWLKPLQDDYIAAATRYREAAIADASQNNWVESVSVESSWAHAASMVAHLAVREELQGDDPALQAAYADISDFAFFNNSRRLDKSGIVRFLEAFDDSGGWVGPPSSLADQLMPMAMLLSTLDHLAYDLTAKRMLPASLMKSGNFMNDTLAISGEWYDYGESQTTPFLRTSLFWLASKSFRTEYAVSELARWFSETIKKSEPAYLAADNPIWANLPVGERWQLAMGYLWLDSGAPESLKLPTEPTANFYPSAQLLALKSPEDPVYFAFKGGHARAGMGAHLDAGSFIFEADGVRWAMDMGMDNTALPDYARGDIYFRQTNLGHNTLTINGELQHPLMASSMQVLQRPAGSTDISLIGLANLTKNYTSFAEGVSGENAYDHVTRGVMVTVGKSRFALISDVIDVAAKSQTSQRQAQWRMFTRAGLQKQEGRSIYLQQDDKVLRVLRVDMPSENSQIPQSAPGQFITASLLMPESVVRGETTYTPLAEKPLDGISVVQFTQDFSDLATMQIALIPQSSVLFDLDDGLAAQAVLEINGAYLNCLAYNVVNRDQCNQNP